jgi:ATP:ADP antiporter, AAA family
MPTSSRHDFEARTSGFAAPTLIALSAAFLLGGYELLRSTSNTLFKSAYGKEGLPWVMTLTIPCLIAVLYIYGRVLSWLGPRRTLLMTGMISCAAIATCFFAIKQGSKFATAALYVVREVYVVLLIEQYWSFLNSTLGTTQAKRLNGPICGVGSIGAICGGLLVYSLSEKFGSAMMIPLAAAAIIPAAILSNIAYGVAGEPKAEAEEPLKAKDSLGLSLFSANPMLIFLLGTVLSTQVLSTALDLGFQGQLQDAIPNSDEQNAFSGKFFAWLNAAAGLWQFVITPLMLRFVPLRGIHISLPLMNAAVCAYFFFSPSLTSAGAAYMFFKTNDYSLFRAAKEILYIPLSFEEVIDVFGYRFGKGGTSLLFTVLKERGVALSDSLFAAVALGGSVLWMILIIPATRRTTESTAKVRDEEKAPA